MASLEELLIQYGASEGNDGCVTVTLDTPLPGGVTQVTLRRPTADDLLATDNIKSSFLSDCVTAARISGLDIKILTGDDMDGYDLNVLVSLATAMIDVAPPEARDRDMEIVTATQSACVPLGVPVTSEGKEIDRVTLRRVNGADMQAAEDAGGGNYARSMVILRRLADMPKATIRSLDAYDFRRLNRQANDFLQKRRRTGAKPSSSSDATSARTGND